MPATSCVRCDEPVEATDRFCEACGVRLTDSPGGVCVACAATEVGTDGYCQRCGRRQPGHRDRVEMDVGTAAGVSDRGVHRRRNEDALMLCRLDVAADGVAATLAVVCDGVSTAARPDTAAQVASQAGTEAMVAALRAHEAAAVATRSAIRVAHQTVIDLADPSAAGLAPACTYVSAVVTAGSVTVGWVGDSRAYWMPNPGQVSSPAVRLTEDDSWVAQVVASGAMTTGEAARHRRAHEITAWLGADAGRIEPHVVTVEPAGPGTVVVCTDGLWNYLENAEELAAALPMDVRETPLRAARRLVDVAVRAGGHDNVTVAVLPFVPPHPGEAS